MKKRNLRLHDETEETVLALCAKADIGIGKDCKAVALPFRLLHTTLPDDLMFDVFFSP